VSSSRRPCFTVGRIVPSPIPYSFIGAALRWCICGPSSPAASGTGPRGSAQTAPKQGIVPEDIVEEAGHIWSSGEPANLVGI
jgi:hypothetical protein